MRGRNVQHLVVVGTGTEQEKFGTGMSLNVMVLQNVQAMTWGMIMIMLAMQFAIMVHIQVEFEAAAVKKDGTECVAAIVCMKFSFVEIISDPQIKNFFLIQKSFIIFFKKSTAETLEESVTDLQLDHPLCTIALWFIIAISTIT